MWPRSKPKQATLIPPPSAYVNDGRTVLSKVVLDALHDADGNFPEEGALCQHGNDVYVRYDRITVSSFKEGIRSGTRATFYWGPYDVAYLDSDGFNIVEGNTLSINGLTGAIKILIS